MYIHLVAEVMQQLRFQQPHIRTSVINVVNVLKTHIVHTYIREFVHVYIECLYNCTMSPADKYPAFSLVP